MVQATAGFQEKSFKNLNIRQTTSVSGATIPAETRYFSCETDSLAPNCCKILIYFICTPPTVPCLLHFPLLVSLFMSLWDTWALGFQALCLFLWLKKEDDAMSVSIQSTSIMLTTLVFLRKTPAAQKTMRAFNTF